MKKTTLIYFIRSGNADYCKIGITDNLPRRIKALQTGNPETLKCLGVIYGDAASERLIHIKLKNHKVRGEWYQLSEALQMLDGCKKKSILEQSANPLRRCQRCQTFLSKKARSPECRKCRRK